MALFFECMLECARKVIDTADIVRDGDITTTVLERGRCYRRWLVSTILCAGRVSSGATGRTRAGRNGGNWAGSLHGKRVIDHDLRVDRDRFAFQKIRTVLPLANRIDSGDCEFDWTSD
jgi:hypothetical protein